LGIKNMDKLGLNEIRERFLKFFESKGHLRLPSFPLVPQNDPSILLINAGMTPLKPYFTGQETPPSTRVTTCQKCIRTPDIENVGKTARHGTFFEMLGNFSFGDYFKKEAIAWAWEFVTEDLKIPEDRLYVSVYEEDDEAYEIWQKDIGIPAEKIVRMGKEDNFWEHGTGPCGPCSEIYYDLGPERGCGSPDCMVGCDCDRYIEFWNLVFTQFNKEEDGSYTPLEKKNIDTGMGLERLAVMMQDVDNLFEVDTIRNILDSICKKAGVTYGKSNEADVSIRVITDHIRSTTMMISDGIMPSNEGRGYVLRRLLRRAARHGKLLGINEPFLYEIAQVVINESGTAYPELHEKADYIKKVIRIEEDRFDATIDQGLTILNEYIEEYKKKNESQLPGDIAFKLHDTFGFPLDLTREIAEENGLGVDEKGFEEEMAKQKKKAREATKSKEGSAWGSETDEELKNLQKTEFTGYDELKSSAKILYILVDGLSVENAQQGDDVTVVLDKTPFYAESGGQAGDKGIIETKDTVVEIIDCKKTADGKHLHVGRVTKGLLEKDAEAEATVDKIHRLSTARNHTTTHILHKALKSVLGDHVNQAGSFVGPDRLRFDFNHFSAMTDEEIKRVECIVNNIILSDLPVTAREMPADEAKKLGAIALFGEKYGDVVRVVQVGDYSTELCGGTHLKNSSQACLVKIVGESGVAAGVRRIEALTGGCAIDYLNDKDRQLDQIAATLKTKPADSLKRLENLSQELKEAQKEIEKLRSKLVSSSTEDLLSNAVDINGVKAIAARFEQMDTEALRNTGDILKTKLGENGVVILAAENSGKVNFVVMATKAAVQKGVHSGNIVKEAAKVTGGGCGGRPDMAQAGGKDTSKIDQALSRALEVLESQIA
jgi:alanyl-tRNA synthetase